MEKWYEKARRYGQNNLTEIDPEVYDPEFWRDFWRRSGTQAIIVNAGGIVAYYPSKFEHHYRAAKLGDRDLFGDIVKAGREEGLAIVARMDINRAVEGMYKDKPQWFARQIDGEPITSQGRYFSCLNSGYYKEFIPLVLQEIIERYKPDGFTDNSWTGIPRRYICHCDNCKEGFKAYSGMELPAEIDYHDPVYRKWVKWSYKCRIDNWDLFNATTKKYGGEDCLWLGMVGADAIGLSNFTDLREIAKRTKVFMVDSQSRSGTGFEQNSLNGAILHQLVGWDKIIPESSASYVRGIQAYRRGASSPLELHLWMLEGFAGGISPWWHIIGSSHEDKRIFDLHMPILEWHKKNEKYLYNRKPVANIGLVWSQDNVEFGSGLLERNRIREGWRGIVMALTRAGLPFLPINAGDLDEQSREMDLLILPEFAVVSDDDVKALEAFVKRGGSIFACGDIGIYDNNGDERGKPALHELLGLVAPNVGTAGQSAAQAESQKESPGIPGWENPVNHTYLRLEDRGSPVFNCFEKTAMIPMGGKLKEIGFNPDSKTEAKTKVLATFIPSFPMYPPEFVWTDNPKTDKAVITEHALEGGGKAIYAAWDLDAAYGRAALPDHGDLIGNIADYLLGEKVPVRVESDAYIDFKVYRQDEKLLIHLINGNNSGFAQGYAEKNIPVGPVSIKLVIPGFKPSKAKLDDGTEISIKELNGSHCLTLERLGVHALIIIE